MRLINQDTIAGLVFVAIAIAGVLIGKDYAIGTAAEMGVGYVPLLACGLLFVLGAIIVIVGVAGHAAALEPIGWRPLFVVTLAALVFAATLERAGVIVAVALTVAVAACARSRPRVMSTIALAVVLAIAVLAIFVWGLSLPLRALPRGIDA